MIRAKLYHHKTPTFTVHDEDCTENVIKHLDFIYEHVANFNFKSNDVNECLEQVFCSSQNIDEAWRDPPCRSTSVGDVIAISSNNETTSTLYEVAPFGFNKIN